MPIKNTLLYFVSLYLQHLTLQHSMDWYFKVLKQYANFHGRARRKEYFYFLIINKLMFTGFHKIGGFLELDAFNFTLLGEPFYANWLGVLYIASVLIPSIAVGARRVQDTGKPGLYGFLFPYCLYLLVKEGDLETNKYGKNPKELSNING